MSAVDVGLCEGERVSERIVNVSLGSKVKDGVDFLLLEDIRHQVRRGNVSLDEFEVGQIEDLVQISKARTVIELVVDNDLVLRILLAQENGSVRRNEA